MATLQEEEQIKNAFFPNSGFDLFYGIRIPESASCPLRGRTRIDLIRLYSADSNRYMEDIQTNFGNPQLASSTWVWLRRHAVPSYQRTAKGSDLTGSLHSVDSYGKQTPS